MPRQKSKISELKSLAAQARGQAGHLLEECYEEELLRGSMGVKAGPGSMADENVRKAILSVLRCQIKNQAAKQADLSVIEKSLNEPIERMYQPETPETYVLLVLVSSNRQAAQMLVDYINLWQSPGGQRLKSPLFVCQKCDKLSVRTRRHERFCSTKCRWDFWNDRKMEGYYKQKAKQSRENKKRKSLR